VASTSRAAVQLGPDRIEIQEIPIPDIKADEGLLRVERCGLCGSDVEQYKGERKDRKYPVIPGHEPVGIIERIGDRAARNWGVQEGDRVIVQAPIPCLHCRRCMEGQFTTCVNKHNFGDTPTAVAPGLWGGYAEYLYLDPNATVHKISKSVPLDIAATFNSLACGVAWGATLPGTKVGDTVVVMGCGQRGLSCLIAAKAAGADTTFVTGLAKDAHKLAMARELGADYVVNIEEEDIVQKVKDVTGGQLADVIIDVVPYATNTLAQAVDMARPGATIVMAGVKGDRPVENLFSDKITKKALRLQGAAGKLADSQLQSIRILESGRFPLDKLHSHTFPLDQAAQALETLAGNVPGETAICVCIAPDQ